MNSGWEALKEYLIGRTGLAYYDDRDQQLRRALEPRMQTVGARDFAAYLHYLQSRPDELEHMIARLTVGETYFFRDRIQFQALAEVVFPDLAARPAPRVWSAGCSIGAEPYSLACVAWRNGGDRLHPLSILATDVNNQALAAAREAVYSEWTLRDVGPHERELFFTPETPGKWRLRPYLAEGVSFLHHNLVSDPIPPTDHFFDLIVCRNVLIYFSRSCIQELLEKFHRALVPGGWLLVGYSEPNVELFKAFEVVNRPGTVLYRRPAGGTPTAPRFSPPAVQALPPPRPEPRPAPPSRESPTGLEELKALADGGLWKEARSLADELLRRDPLEPRTHFYRALVHEHLGDLAESDRAYRQAIYLDRTDPLAHYYRGVLQRRRGALPDAARSFRTVVRLLEGRDPALPVAELEGVSVSDLKALAQVQLAGLEAS